MANSRVTIQDLENLVKHGEKKFARKKEGAQLYSMGVHTFENIARDAGAVYRVKRIVLYNTEIINEYLEAFREVPEL